MKIGFIGAGNMGGAILRGYAPAAKEQGHSILVFDPKEAIGQRLENELDVVTACNNIEELVSSSDIMMLGIKPNQFETVLPTIAPHYQSDKIFISMAAGITIEFIEKHLGKNSKVIRIMPNTPAQVREAMVAVCRNENVDDRKFADILTIFNSLGKAEEITEDLMHCVIGVSGSSPAYTYMYIDALMQAAAANGMEKEKAKVFAAQAVLGAAKMVLESDIDPEQLRINVCSPGGTTIEAVEKLFENKFQDNLKEGFQAAVDKSKKMSE